MNKCPGCGEYNEDSADYCAECGKQLRKTRRPRFTGGETATKTAAGELKPWTIVALILAVIGLFLSFIGFWLLGLPLMIAAGYFAYTQGSDIVPRVTLLFSMMALFWIPAIPGSQLISAVGFAVAWMSIILMLPTEPKGESYRVKGLWIGAIAVGTTIAWTWGVVGVISGNLFDINVIIMLAINPPMVIASIIWKAPIPAGYKLGGTLACFSILIIIVVRFVLIWGLASWGGLVDRAQVMFSQDLGLSGSALDMILNPTLAVQAGLKPATQKEVTETAAPPTLAYTVSGSLIPDSGCYDDSSFQVIAKVTNTGGEFIKDLNLLVVHKKVEAPLLLDLFPNPCKEEHISDTCDELNGDIKSLPQGVTLSRQCVVNYIEDTGAFVEFEGMEQVTPQHTCFFDIIGTTGYHAVSRLPIELIEEEYGRNKFEQKQLVQRIVPSVTSVGPVDLSLGGFEQPILHTENGTKVTMITTITKSGPGRVQDYTSAYLYIPNKLLLEKSGGDYQCSGINDDWICINDLGDASDLGSNTAARRHYDAFLKFKDNEEIGNDGIGWFEQFDYDNSHKLLDEDYSICFFTEDISTLSLITTGTCTLTVKNVLKEDIDLRKTLLIRGDVLYTYNISVPLGITVRDCDI